MDESDLSELHYIVSIRTLQSIMKLGILSHLAAKNVEHESIAMTEIQDRRAKVTVPGGNRLHDYVNLYFHARNPMMWVRRAQREDLCVLRVNPAVLTLPGVVITDGNAASDYTDFRAAPNGLKIVDAERTYAEDWRHPDQIEYFRRKSAKCAEVLVPNKVEPSFLDGCYVCSDDAQGKVAQLSLNLAVQVDAHMFFAD